MESESSFIAVDTNEFFDTIRKDELEILKQLKELEIYDLDEDVDPKLIIDTGQKTLAILGYNPPTKITIPSTNRFYSEVEGKNGTIPTATIYSYEDVFGLDGSLRKKDAKLYCLYNPTYQGCVWVFENEDYLGLYGIRSSIANTINGKKGIARKIMEHVITSTNKRIIIPWPLEGMVPLLEKLGFKKHVLPFDDYSSPVRNFLSPYTLTCVYWMLSR